MATSSFFVPRYKHLYHYDDELKNEAMEEIKRKLNELEQVLEVNAQPTRRQSNIRNMPTLFSDDAVEVVDEITLYLSDANKSMEPLEYWKCNAKQYPVLSRMAVLYLLPLASSAPAERVFSEARNIEMRKRYHMVEDTLSAYVLIRGGF